MISDFLIMQASGPFFRLSDIEFQEAVKKYPSLQQDTEVNYVKNTATGSINVGEDNYFDNIMILRQFERMFQLLEFKTEYKNHRLEILVDNARTRRVKDYSINDFGKGSGTRCPVQMIEYTDQNNVKQTLNCFFTSDPMKGQIVLNGDRTECRKTKCRGQNVADKMSYGQNVAGQNVARQNIADISLRTKCRGQMVGKKTSHVPIELRKTDRGDDFILYEDDEMIIFTTKKNLSLLKECKHCKI
ncbi:unnamed protein product [Didymodactylos carnosus]|uniref:Uncharacterized protein n=2 Tax=Didymodactylos carnosus TaxID=1234261 RepID=A0A814JNJ7_9BILA|nr:unnamed protein product [Didymodactylos carnosus]CAF3811037.1 unnamed protein product [Didymodactylos carnosus]